MFCVSKLWLPEEEMSVVHRFGEGIKRAVFSLSEIIKTTPYSTVGYRKVYVVTRLLLQEFN